ncbi:MAG: CHASE2 domain-containing protein [Scytonematopsis contorta HA4267-MV1]|jgi:CHASE2 domain-containing sensor protein|nr:CHASE2 domain-containing protein [Scytonematopsis contorta HA4267-MV1]
MNFSNLWQRVKKNTSILCKGGLPGLAVTGCVVITRLTGGMQTLEWMAFDTFWRSHPLEPADTRVVIVGINEEDIRAVGDYPIPDKDLAKLLKKLQSYKPRVIGLDIFRDLSKNKELSQVLANSPNLIGIEQLLGDTLKLKIKPPPQLPTERVGFADMIFDADGKLRRVILSTREEKSKKIRYSLSLLLAKHYLEAEGIKFEHGKRVTSPISFGNTQLPRFRSNTGAYVKALSGGYQMLLAFRNNPQPFSIVTLSDILNSQVKPELFRDNIVIIGMTAVSVKDYSMTSAVKDTLFNKSLTTDVADQYKLIYGVEIHAHATSQIISSVLDNRIPVYAFSDELEHIWILAWGAWGIALGLLLQSPWKTLLSIVASSFALTGICYGMLNWSCWVPFVPSLLALIGAGLTTSFFDSNSKALLEERSLTLKRTYDKVHNGPLQTLAAILRSDEPSEELRKKLQELNHELRAVFEFMNQSLIFGDESYLQTPLPELLYQVYEHTLGRDLPGFTTIVSYIPPDFSPLEDCPLTVEQKQSLCIFLQEALCNVGKHAAKATCLDVFCRKDKAKYSLFVIDNGVNLEMVNLYQEGRGSVQAKELARLLKGKFSRRQNHPSGTVCELTWSINTLNKWMRWR